MKPRLILAAFLAVALASCGKHSAEHHKGQVAAKVNGHEITVFQVNSMLSHVGKVKASQSQQVTDRVVRNLVNQELLVQQAIKKKLDRNPAVLQAILESRKQVLAQAYLTRRFDTLSPPTNSAIRNFYNTHPDLFAHRQIYRAENIVIGVDPSKTALIQKQLTTSKGPKAFVAWLKSQHMPFHAEIAVRAAEQLPFPVLKQLSKMRLGQAVIGQDGAHLVVLVLLGEAEQPKTLAQASDAIKAFLVRQDQQKMVKQTLQGLRAAATIKYFGTYVGAEKIGSSATKTPEKPTLAGTPIRKTLP
ncbi:MAG: EpsD family peptidyl-prolyl cis-trans isomerase [Acidobacteriaceae bacterium]